VYSGLSSPTPSAQLRIESTFASQFSSRANVAVSMPSNSRARSMSSSLSS
jgi:hypothetical protein